MAKAHDVQQVSFSGTFMLLRDGKDSLRLAGEIDPVRLPVPIFAGKFLRTDNIEFCLCVSASLRFEL